MNKKEIAEIKKQYTQEKCPITRVCGCYVDAEKNKKTEFGTTFLSLPEEEFFKYLTIFRKVMSGTLGKNLLTMDFPLDSEQEGGTQEMLMKLKYTALKDEGVLEEFYDQIIESYYYVGNYLILLMHAVYDVPGKSSDNLEMFDASDEVYEHVICCICPVNLAKPCLSYHEHENCIASRTQDWLVENPLIGFLFPAFHDRSADVHSLLYYCQKPEKPADDFVDTILGCSLPLTAANQKETFQQIVEETLGDACSFETVRALHDTLNEMIEEKKDEPEPLVLDRQNVRRLLEEAGAEEETLSDFESCYEENAGERTEFVASNLANKRKFEVRTPDVVIQVSPEKSNLIQERMIDGRRCLVIAVEEGIEVNGIAVK